MPDMNSRIRTYLLTFYVVQYPAGIADTQALLVKYLREQLSGDYNNRWKAFLAQV